MEQTVAELMDKDHRRLEQLWEQCLEGVKLFDLGRIRDRFGKFDRGMRRHIQAEEEVLLPAFEAHAVAGAVESIGTMRAEHREIEAALERLSSLMTARDLSTLIVTLEGQPSDPTAIFQSHAAKERLVYSMMDAAFAAGEKTKLLQRARERLTSNPA